MAITMLCHVDNVSYKEKPKNQVGAVQNRFKTSDFMSIDVDKVIKALESGQTIALANCEDRKKDKFKAANSAALDFDNGHSTTFEKSEPAGRAAIVKAAITGGTISKQEVIDRCREKGFAAPTFIYSTFSAGQYIQDCLALAEQGLITAEELDRIQSTSTFRAVWVFNHTVNDPAIYTDVCERLRKIFPESDPAFKIEGVLFGTKYSDTQRTDEIVDITTIPYPPQEQESSDPEQITDPPPQQGFRVDLSAANTRSYSAMSQSDSQRRNIEIYLTFLKPSMLDNPGDGKEWIRVANAMKTEGFSYSEFDSWCKSDGDPRYNEVINLKRWNNITPGKNYGGTIEYYAKTYGHMTPEAFKAALYPQGMKPKHTTAPAEFVAYNWDGTSEDQPQPITLEQIKAYTPEQWNELAKQHFNGIPLNNDRVIEKFKQLFIKCLKARLLQNKRLPEYIQPVVKSRRENGAEFVSITGFEINHVPLASSLYNDLHIVNITSKDNAAGMLYVYKHGKYERIDPEEERGIVRKRVEYIDKYGKMWNAKTIKDTSLLLHSPLEVHELEDFNTDEKIINFQNGLLDLESGTLYPHTHNVLSTVQLPLIYDPNAGTDTPLFDSMIDHFADGDEEVKTLLLQFCAATISNIDMGTVKCFLMLYGAGDSGKSQLFQLLHKLVGKKNTHTTTLSDLTANRFEPINLYGMRFAGDPELEYTVSITHAAKIKQYTGGDNIRGEVKCGGTFQFKYKGTLLFCSNERPRILSADTAFYNRLRMIYVKKPVENIDRRFLEKMWEERQRIINKLMPYVCEIIKCKTIIDPVSSKELKKQYKVFNNPAIEFFTECCKMRTAEEISPTYRKKISDNRTAANVYDKFVEWYDANGYPRQDRPDRPSFAKSIGHYLKSENITDMDDVRIKKNGGIQYYIFRDLTDAEIAAQQQDEIENAAPSAPADSQPDEPPPIWETELF